jgi:peptidoglycan/xylan/chitin deacetylase (PgdA/CDA1 family)
MIPSEGSSAKKSGATRMAQHLTYHELANTEPKYLYSISAARFAEHARFLRTLADRERSESDSRHITFDDGHISQFDLAFPILKELSIKAIFFVTAGWIGRREGCMSWKHLEEIARDGYEIQSHGWSHAYLSRCSNQELHTELRRSKCELENHLGIKVSAISAPGGRWDRRVLSACLEAGYERLFTSDPCITRKKEDGIEVSGRWMVTRTTDANEIPLMLDGRGARVALMRVRNLTKATARRVIGDRAYQTLWRTLARKERSLESHYPSEGKT